MNPFRPTPLALAIGLLLPALAGALPTGEQPNFGQAQVSRPAAGQLRIDQQSQRAGLDWRSFSIGAGEQVVVQQPGRDAVLVNRVLGDDPSLIFGSLQANGRVFLSNPRGIVFGAGSRLDVGGLLATTLQFADAASSDRLVTLQGGGSAELRADGEIHSQGLLALVAPRLRVGGSLQGARVGLAAADAVQVDVEGDGLIFFNLRGEQLANRLDLLGQVDAGNAELRAAARAGMADTVLNLDGVVRATGLGQAPGRIVVDAGTAGTLLQSGRLEASNAGGLGGDITLTAERIALQGAAELRADGRDGGGRVRVGGDWQGSGDLFQARQVEMGEQAQISASATQTGLGGTVVLWSRLSAADGLTRVAGRIATLGQGADSGGRVETSGARLGVSGRVDPGANGLWLLDPWTMTVVDGSGGNSFNPNANVTVDSVAINTALASGNVTLDVRNSGAGDSADGIIIVNGNISWSSDRNLTLQTAGANGGLSGSGSIQHTGSSGTPELILNQSGATSFSGRIRGDRLAFTKNGNGALTLSGDNDFGRGSTLNAGAIVLDGGGAKLGASSSGIALNGNRLDLRNGASIANSLSIGNNAIIESSVGGGALSGSGQLDVPNGGTLNLSAGAGSQLSVGQALIDGNSSSNVAIGGAGSVLLSNAPASNVYSGDVTIASGATLGLSGGVNRAGSGNIVFVSGTSTLDLRDGANAGNNITFAAGGRVTSSSGTGTLGQKDSDTPEGLISGQTLSLSSSNGATLRVERPFTDPGAIAIDGGLVLLTRNSDSSGTVAVNSGTLRLDGSGASLGTASLSLGANTLQLGNGISFGNSLTVANGARIEALGGSATLSSAIAIPAAATLTLRGVGSGNQLTLSGVISGASGQLAVDSGNTGSVLLSGANSFGGNLTLDAGTLIAGNASALGGGSGISTVASGGTLQLAGVSVAEAITLNGGTLRGSGTAVLSQTLSLGASSTVEVLGGAQLSVTGTLAGSGQGLDKTGAGRLLLNPAAANALGSLTISAGALQLGNANALPSALQPTVTGTLELGSSSLQLAGLAGSGTVDLGSGTLTLAIASGSSGFNGTLAGGGSLVKSGAGTLSLGGSNSYNGSTSINQGRLVVASSSALGTAAGGSTVSAGAELELQADPGSELVALTGGGRVVVDSGNRSLNGLNMVGSGSAQIASGAQLTLTGALSGSGTLSQTGAGTLLLSASNAGFTGALATGSLLAIDNALALNAGFTTQLNNGSTLELRGVSVAASSITTVGSVGLQTTGSGNSLGGSLSLGGTLTATVGAGSSLALPATLSGVGGLTKAGAGELVLSGSNSYSGRTLADAGLLHLSGSGSLGNTSDDTRVAAGAVLLLDGVSVGSESLQLNGGVLRSSGSSLSWAGNVLLGASSSVDVASGDLSLSGVISGSGDLAKTGAGSLSLSGSNSYSGATSVNAGTLVAASASALGSTAGGSSVASGATLQLSGVAVAGEALSLNGGSLRGTGSSSWSGNLGLSAASTVDVASAGSLALSGVLSGSGDLVKTGAGSLSLSGNNSYSGATTVSAGRLVVASANALGSTAAGSSVASGATLELLGVSVGNEALQLGGSLLTSSSSSWAGVLTLGSGSQLQVDAAQQLSLGAGLAGSGGLNKSGAGTLLLNGASSYSGATTVTAGTLSLGVAQALPAASGLSLASGTALNLNNHSLSLAGLDGSGSIALGSATLTVNGSGSSDFAGLISGSGGLVKQGSGSLLLRGANSYDGSTQVQAGSLQLSGSGSLGSSLGGSSVASGATLQLQAVNLGAESLQLAGQLQASAGNSSLGALVLGSGSSLAVDSGSQLTLNGALSGSGGLSKTGAGSLVLNGAGSYSGATSVAAGSLSLGTANALPAGTALTVNGQLQGNGLGWSVASLAGSGSVQLGAGGSLSVGDASSTVFAGSLSGGALTKVGSGTLTLSGSNSHTGLTTVSAGRLVAASNSALGSSAAGTVVAAGAELELAGASIAAEPVQLSGALIASGGASSLGAALQLQGGSSRVQVDGGPLTLSGGVSGSAELAKQGSGTLVLAAAGSQTSTRVEAGTLQQAAAGALPTGSSLLVASGATVQLGGFATTLGSLDGGGALQLGNATLSLASGSFAGVISGNGGLNKTGLGNLLLTGANSFAGSTQVLGGLLQLGDSANGLNTGGLGAGSLQIASGAELRIDRSGSLQLGGPLSGAGLLQLQGGASLLLNGNNNGFSGLLRVAGASLQLQGGNALGDGATLALQAGATAQLSGSETTGQLQAAAGSSLQLDSGATLALGAGGTASQLAGSLSGSGTLQLDGGSLLFSGGSPGFNGLLAVNAGTLSLAASERLGNASSLRMAGISARVDLGAFNETVATLQLQQGRLDGSGTLTAASYQLQSGSVQAALGSGSLSKTGSGTVQLNRASAATSSTVSDGVLQLAGANLISGTLTLNGANAVLDLGTHDQTGLSSLQLLNGSLTGSGRLTAASYVLESGSVLANLGAGTLTKQGSGTVLLAGDAQAGSVNLNGGRLLLGASERLADSGDLTIDSGVLDLASFNERVGSLQIRNGGSVAGSGILFTDIAVLEAGAVSGTLNAGTLRKLTAGTATLLGQSTAATVEVLAGTLQLGASERLAPGASLRIDNGARFDLQGFNQTVAALQLDNGVLDGSGRLSVSGAAALRQGSLNADVQAASAQKTGSGSLLLQGQLLVPELQLLEGRVELAASQRLAASSRLLLNGSSAQFALGNFDQQVAGFELRGGAQALGGSGTLSSAVYALYDGQLAAQTGSGELQKLGPGSVLLAGSSGAGSVRVMAGSLQLAAADRLANASTLRLEGGRLDLGGFSETVGSLTLQSGQLDGSGTLTAASYELQSGTVNANLGAGALSKTGSGTVLLAGQSNAGTVSLNDGTLRLLAAERLAGDVSLAGANAVLDLGSFSDSVARFTLQAGRLDGSGTLTAASYELQSGTVNANLGAGALSKTGSGTVLLAGQSNAGTVSLNDGTLRLLAAERLAGEVSLAGANAVLDLGSFSDSVAGFTLQAGRLDGSGTLTAASYELQSGTVNANLGAGALSKTGSGTVLLAGQSNAGTVSLNDGTLRLLAADRLAGDVSLIGANAVLDLGSFSDSVAGFTLQAGRLDGSGTLTAASYELQSGTVNASLGAGALSKTGSGTVQLNGSAASSELRLSAGSLQLGAAERLDNAANLRVDGGQLNLAGFADTVGTLRLDQGEITGGGSLSAGQLLLLSGRVASELRGPLLRKEGSGLLRLDGLASVAAVELQSGTLQLGAGERLAAATQLRVAGGQLDLNRQTQTVASLLLTDGELGGGGLLRVSGAAELQQGRVASALEAASLRKSGTGTARVAGLLRAAQADLQAGTLLLEAAERLDASTRVQMASAATLQLSGDQTLGSLGGAGSVQLGSANLRTGAAGDSRFDGVISGDGAVVKQGSSVWRVGAEQTHRGGTRIEAGELRLVDSPAAGPSALAQAQAGASALGGGGQLGSGPVQNDGQLAVERSGALMLAQDLSGSGQLLQAGSGTLSLAGDNRSSGGARVLAGSTLQLLGRGSLGSGAVQNDGQLVFARDTALTLNQRITGSGGLEQRGPGALTLGSALESSGDVLVSSGQLQTAGAERLADASRVRVAAGAELLLGGSERLQSLDASGLVRALGDISASGELRFGGGLRLEGSGPQALAGSRIVADSSSNALGSQALSLTAGELLLNAPQALSLGRLQLGGGRISAPQIQLDGELRLSSGNLLLQATAAPAAYTSNADGKTSPNDRLIALADSTLRQGSASTVLVDPGASLLLAADGGGSIRFEQAGNRFAGSLSARSGAAFGEAWSDRESAGGGTGRSNQAQIRLAGSEIQVGGAGLEADLIHITTDRLQTTGGAVIAARLPFNNDRGTASQLPGLTLVMSAGAFNATLPFGSGGSPLQLRVGVQAAGGAFNAGLVLLQPQPAPDGGRTPVFAEGPQASPSYRFFYPGAGIQGETPIIFNGVVPTTPEVLGTLSATVAVSESARKERFDEAVRTENVALRLRAGVIAEVGAGRPATSGGQGLRLPELCPPASLLGCAQTRGQEARTP